MTLALFAVLLTLLFKINCTSNDITLIVKEEMNKIL